MLASQREDWARALNYYTLATQAAPLDLGMQLEVAQVMCSAGQPEEAVALLKRFTQAHPNEPMAWLLLGEALDDLGQSLASCKARHQALTKAHRRGEWTDVDTTPPGVLDRVMANFSRLRQGQREHLMQVFEPLRHAHGAKSVERIERALLGYLREIDLTPPDPRQRPKFLYIPGLPDAPYHDPMLQPWAAQLLAGWTDLRDEALALLGDNENFESFLGLKPGDVQPQYVGGSGPNPAWDAFFFYRHGKRFDDNHARCPKSSALIESITLCRVENQAPEVCFSVIRPGSQIMAHYGVTNSRLVMHVPLVVPASGCALNVLGAGEHAWREGELMMFDDTFQHEAWNHSAEPRVILLMDCWNPHLSAVEQVAVKSLVEAIDAFEQV
jgi:aspartate beta-hydroxylase